MDAQLGHAAAEAFRVSEIALLDPLQPGGDPDLRDPILQPREPGCLFLGRQHREHGATVTYELQAVKGGGLRAGRFG